VERAVIATRAVAGCNTNLGILLLCAPVARAAERAPRADADALMAALREVLDTLDVADARAAYRAIAVANPGGLGSAAAQDVAAAPTLDLRSAMALAAGRDLIARQYACGFEDILAVGLEPFLRDREHTGRHDLWASVQALFLRFLTAFPDSHIARKFGLAAARAVSAEALPWLDRLQRDAAAGASAAFVAWDESLKRRGFNPGTSADLTVCTLFIAALLDPALLACAPEGA
jgi:triphosphoribosyl-dephospho-CoA synthase